MSFEDTMKHVAEMEGGWANNPADGGGETFRGIARNFHKSWPGWAMIDAAKKSGAATAKLIDAYFKNDDSMTALVNDFYKKQFWDAVPVEITGKLREKFFDTSINLGKKGASIVLQRALNALGSNLIVDGAIGKLTKAALAKYTEPRILSQYVKAQEKYYRDIVARKPSQNVFLKGWLRRAAWLPL